MGRLHIPKKACDTCPYRRDTPPGIWSKEEYEKLPRYDQDDRRYHARDLDFVDVVPEVATFHCHQENATGVDTVCRGWLSTAGDSIAARLAVMNGLIDIEDIPPEVEDIYYATGREACDAGLAGIENPGSSARKKMASLWARGAGKFRDDEEES